VDAAALEATIRQLGWRVYGTNQLAASLSLAQAVLAYRSEFQVERSLGRLKGRPLSRTPMSVQRDDHATGRIRWLAIALRVLTLWEFVGRRQWAAEGGKLAGLYAGKHLLGNLSRKGCVPIRGSACSVTQDTYIFVVLYSGDHPHADPQTALSR
jgi:hypothetical protein